MNRNNFEKGRSAELKLQRIFDENGYCVVDLGAVPESSFIGVSFPHATLHNMALILPDMLVSKDGKATWVECKAKGPTNHGYFGMGAKNFADARQLSEVSGIGYAYAVCNDKVPLGDDPWFICRPFEPRWVGNNGFYERGGFAFIRESCFRSLRRCLAISPQKT